MRRVTVTTKNTSFSQGLGSLLTSSKDVLLMRIVKSSLNDRRKAESYMLISLMFHLSVTGTDVKLRGEMCLSAH